MVVMDRWANKVALVTGASSGIGKSIAEKLAKHGMKVVACARNMERLQEFAAAVNKECLGEIFPYACDISDEEQIQSMFKFIKGKFGKLHVCVNNAGLAMSSSILSGSSEVSCKLDDSCSLLLFKCSKAMLLLIMCKNLGMDSLLTQ